MYWRVSSSGADENCAGKNMYETRKTNFKSTIWMFDYILGCKLLFSMAEVREER